MALSSIPLRGERSAKCNEYLALSGSGRCRTYSAFLPYLFSEQTSYPIEYATMTEDTFFTCSILSVQGCVSQRYYAFALYASSCAICYNFRRCHGYMLAMPHFSHSIKFTCQLMRTPLVYKVLATTLSLNDRIWTCNLLNPNQAHCQIVLHSDETHHLPALC